MTKIKYKKRWRQNKAGQRNFAIGRVHALAMQLQGCKKTVGEYLSLEQWRALTNAEVAIAQVYSQLAAKYYRRK